MGSHSCPLAWVSCGSSACQASCWVFCVNEAAVCWQSLGEAEQARQQNDSGSCYPTKKIQATKCNWLKSAEWKILSFVSSLYWLLQAKLTGVILSYKNWMDFFCGRQQGLVSVIQLFSFVFSCSILHVKLNKCFQQRGSRKRRSGWRWPPDFPSSSTMRLMFVVLSCRWMAVTFSTCVYGAGEWILDNSKLDFVHLFIYLY